MSTDQVAAPVVLIDFLAVNAAAGQETRARAFLARVEAADAVSRFVLLRARGALPNLPAFSNRVSVVDVSLPNGIVGTVARFLWEAVYVRRIIEQYRVTAYLTFSHYLPPGVRCWTRVVGVSNLAPFDQRAWQTASWPQRLRLSLLRRSILRSVHNASDVIALSAECRRRLMDCGVHPGNIHVISNGSDSVHPGGAGEPSSTQARATPAEARAAPPFLLSISNFYSYKNFEVLIDAWGLLPVVLREGHVLKIVGYPADARYFEKIRKRAQAQRGVHIELIPGLPRPQLAALYRQCTAFVFPSLIENSPNILLEAMAAGAAIASSNVEPMPEFCGEAVLYFQPHAPAELADVMVQLLSDASLRQRLQQQAVLQAGKYTWDALVSRTVTVYRRRAACA